MVLTLTDIIIRVLVSLAFGAIVGFEREIKECPAGLRTHALVCLGATIFTMTSTLLAGPYVDASRVAGQIVVGIGFIGGGVIFKSKEHIIGLTTAASLWVVAALGLVAGLGEYLIGVVTLLATLFILVVGFLLEKTILHKKVKNFR